MEQLISTYCINYDITAILCHCLFQAFLKSMMTKQFIYISTPPSGVENLINNDDNFFFVDRSCLSFELSKIGISSVAAALHMHTALAWLVWSVLISRKLKKKQGSRVAATSRLSVRQLQHRKDDLKGQFIFFCVLYTFNFNGVINCHLPPYPYPMLKYSLLFYFIS